LLALRNWPVELSNSLFPDDTADGDVSRWQDSATPLSIARISTPDGAVHRLRMNSELAIDVFPDGRLVARSDGPVAQNTLDHFLADQVIPRILAHRGDFVCHSGAVRCDDAALMFVGASGRGKSTLAASFNLAGHALLGDDAMVVSWSNHIPHVRSVYPSLRLFPDALAALMPDAPTAGPMAQYSTKQRIDVEVADEGDLPPLPVRALFVIDAPTADGTIAICPLSVADACMALVGSSFALDPNDMEQAKSRLTAASRLASAVPAFRLAFERSFDLLSAVRQAIFDAVPINGG
jgi:hypothetical protein